MPTSKYKTIIETVIDEEVTRIEVCLDLHSISPEQYTSEGVGEQPTPGVSDVETTEVVECLADIGNTEFPVNTNYSFCDTTLAEPAYIPIYCDAGIVKCKINFNASSNLLNMFDIFTSTIPLATTPESKYNRYTGDKDVYVFFKCKVNDNYSIYSPGISQSEGYTFAKGQSLLIVGNRGEIGHICRIAEPIPKEVLAAAVDRTRTITVNLTGMESLVWESVNENDGSIGIDMKNLDTSKNVYLSWENMKTVNYEPKSCYAVMGSDAGEIVEAGQSWERYISFSKDVPYSGAILRLSNSLCSYNSIPQSSSITTSKFSKMVSIGNKQETNGTADFRIGPFYSGANNTYSIDFYTYRGYKPNVGSAQYNSVATYVILQNVFVSKFDDAYVDDDK